MFYSYGRDSIKCWNECNERDLLKWNHFKRYWIASSSQTIVNCLFSVPFFQKQSRNLKIQSVSKYKQDEGTDPPRRTQLFQKAPSYRK